MRFVRTFKEVGAGDVGLVGGKGANLGEMTRAGLPVPPGFCLTAHAYRAFITSARAGETVRQILIGLQIDDPEDVDVRCEQIRNFLTAQQTPTNIADQVLRSYHQLGAELDSRVRAIPVAVRSSATAEDLPTASFAGQQDTYLNVRGDADLLTHVKRCWASLWTARAVTYRVKQRFDHEQVALAVVVQAMIPSEVSGILFTANPVSGDRDDAVINASWGLGESVVSGLVTPDTFNVRKSDGAIRLRQIATKEREIDYAEAGGTIEQDVSAERRDIPSLSDAQVTQLGVLSQRIENHYGSPMDIEWAYANGRFYILQARAITTLGQQVVKVGADVESASVRGEYNRSMFVEIFPDPLSPIFLSVIQPLFNSMLDFTFETWGFKPPKGIKGIGVFHNQPYFNREYIAAALKPLSAPVRERLVAQSVNPFSRHDRGMRIEISPVFAGWVLRLLRFMIGFPAQLPGLVSRHRAEIREIESYAVETMPDREIIACIRKLVFDSASRLLNYDFLMIELVRLTHQVLGAMLERYYGAESEQVRCKLISGITGNVTMETNKHLWDLAQTAKASQTVSSLIRQYKGPELMLRLRQSPEGRAFHGELERFLKEYGHREVRMDILYPTWSEDSTPVLDFVRGYLDVGENQNPHWQQQRLIQQREETARVVQARIQHDLMGRYLVWPIFRWVLKHAEVHTRERDTMHFELTRMFPPFRRLLLELGRRWTERGRCEQPSDVFFEGLDELAVLAESPRSIRNEVRERRAEFEANKLRPVPSVIRDGVEILAEAATSAETLTGQLRGIAGSPGTVSGVVRIIRGPEEFAKLQCGDILVAPLTNPVWTPLFAIAGGVITEVGGILSHGAIVAREYGIPAVMAVAGATKSLREGQRLTVDGNRGIVFLEPGTAA